MLRPADRHQRAAARHEKTAARHQQAATFWEKHGDDALTQLHRAAAAHERAGAALERRWANVITTREARRDGERPAHPPVTDPREHDVGPSRRDPVYDSSPAARAEHDEQPEVSTLLAARKRPDTRTPQDLADAPPARSAPANTDRPVAPGAATRTVAAAFTAVLEQRLDDLAKFVAPDIEWRGITEADGRVPRCTTREQATERMQIGLLARGQVSVSAFIENGNRVLAHVHRIAGKDNPDEHEEGPPWVERFVVAEVSDGVLVRLSGYATEQEAHDDLRDATPARRDGKER